MSKILNLFRKKSNRNITGTGNVVYALGHDGEWTPYAKPIPGLQINITGNNNKIYIASIDNFVNCKISIGVDNCELRFGKQMLLGRRPKEIHNLVFDALWNKGDNDKRRFIIGDYCFVNGMNVALEEPNASLIIGNNCIISWSVSIKTDYHSVIDRKTRRAVNMATGPITIGNNCWIGYHAALTKNARIPNNTIVGAFSVVTKPFTEEYTAIAGNPAKVIRKDVTWDFAHPDADRLYD